MAFSLISVRLNLPIVQHESTFAEPAAFPENFKKMLRHPGPVHKHPTRLPARGTMAQFCSMLFPNEKVSG
jgi:hypothetical protein